jgi:hypothetical protein
VSTLMRKAMETFRPRSGFEWLMTWMAR